MLISSNIFFSQEIILIGNEGATLIEPPILSTKKSDLVL